MKKIFLLSCSILFFSCTHDDASQIKKEKAIAQSVSGKYVNETCVKEISDSVAGYAPFFATQLNFISSDSVVMENGFESGLIAYKKNDDKNYTLIKASFRGDMKFSFNEDGSLTLINNYDNPKQLHQEKYIKLIDSTKNFPQFLNQYMITGEYQLTSNKKEKQIAVFNNDGKVTGIDDYTRYDICYSGDCLSEINERMNIIYLYNNVRQDAFAFKGSKKMKQIDLYEITAFLIENEKGNGVVGDKIYELKIK